jgi:uncharacterized protein YjeT (DUF2065 family)
MKDFLVAVGLVFVIEGLVFAAFPQVARLVVTVITETPEPVLRTVGLGSAIAGVVFVWLLRG